MTTRDYAWFERQSGSLMAQLADRHSYNRYKNNVKND